jgi:hypothetical protein
MGTELKKLIGELLGQLENSQPLDEEKLAQVRAALEQASHDGPCPCESGQKFCHCCKLDWLVLRDRGNEGVGSAPADLAPAEEKGNGAAESKPESKPQWICRVGIQPEGSICVEPMPGGINVPPIRTAELLLGAYHVVNFNATISTVQAMLRRGQMRTTGPAVRSAFDN